MKKEDIVHLKSILFDMINDRVKYADMFQNGNEISLILTKEKVLIFNLDGDVLWYNSIFFSNIFKYLSLDVFENQHYITEWVEDTILNGLKLTLGIELNRIDYVESIIQNGLKLTPKHFNDYSYFILENVVQNGVKLNHDKR